MPRTSQSYIELVCQLAQEYNKKYSELKRIADSLSAEELVSQLRGLAELSTNRFRGAQQALFGSLMDQQGDDEHLRWQAAVALSQCFDEMRVLFQIMLDYSSQPPVRPLPD